MDTRIIHFQLIAVSLFLLLFLYKTILLLLGKKSQLRGISKKAAVIEMILGLFIIGSGIYILKGIGSSHNDLSVKVLLVLSATILGIIGPRRESKIMTIFALLIFIYVYSVTEIKGFGREQNNFSLEDFNWEGLEKSAAENILNANNSASLQQGKVIYKVLCVECHGEDGKELLEESANLAESKLSMEEKVEVIMHGRGSMHGYESELSEQEITLVAAYTETLK